MELELPPLRDRVEDIEMLARHFAQLYARKYQQTPREFSPQALDALKQYAWPGNIRALRHTLERAVILSSGDRFEPEDFNLEPTASQPDSGPLQRQELNLEKLEHDAIHQALTANRYNISRAAKALGLTRAALYRRMEKHGL